jgi:ubiquitin carboxyl-terminal hydrolase 36/42
MTRSVARPIANLGNTCFLNAVLQALGHAPELCLAIDCQPHAATCPIRHRPTLGVGTRKSRRGGGRKSPPSEEEDDASNFCVLCEFENHVRQVHDPTMRDKPVAPENFVNGFIQHVAPWFKLGTQEDSHEFLRLLIDAMQKSCQKARAAPHHQGPQEDNSDNQNHVSKSSSKDVEYPFSLFRGMVESNVTCDSCKTSSSTLDPIEDIGLEVTTETSSATNISSHSRSRNNSPVPGTSAAQLADVSTAFGRFIRAEALDAGYKCETCGRVGRATKRSRLASIPPILTLHLKRFRYGDSRATQANATSLRRRSEVNQLLGRFAPAADFKSGSAKIEGRVKFDVFFDLKPYLTDELQKSPVSTFCRLFAVIVHAGKNSHSGHYIAYVRSLEKNDWWKMDDGRVTPVPESEVKEAEAYMLFYRVVQHPVAIELEEAFKKKKMQEQQDEAVKQTMQETSDDAVKKQMPETHDEAVKNKLPETQDDAVRKKMPETTDTLVMKKKTTEHSVPEPPKPMEPLKPTELTVVAAAAAAVASDKSTNKRKRAAYSSGEEWARVNKTHLSPYMMVLMTKVQDLIAKDVRLSPSYVKVLQAAAERSDGCVADICGA